MRAATISSPRSCATHMRSERTICPAVALSPACRCASDSSPSSLRSRARPGVAASTPAPSSSCAASSAERALTSVAYSRLNALSTASRSDANTTG